VEPRKEEEEEEEEELLAYDITPPHHTL